MNAMRMASGLGAVSLIVLAVAATARVESAEDAPKGEETALKTPDPLRIEHSHLHAELKRAIDAGGKTGKAAKAVAEAMAPHFEAEERIAMPPLGLLAPLSRGEATPEEMKRVLPLTEQLKEDLPEMLEEHQRIVAALEKLAAAAKAEGKPEYQEFANKLILHARTEEEVLYPAAILVGEYVKLKLAEGK